MLKNREMAALADAQLGRLSTLRPRFAVSTPDASDDVLQDVAAGTRDDELQALARVARNHAPQVVLLRWGHEMELSNLYPWADREPEAYRLAYRHVVSVFRAEGADNVRFVWSPAGNANALGYYPGGDVVDYVGLSVLGDRSWDATMGFSPQSFDELLAPRYARVAPLGKPIIVAEFGVSGDAAHQTEWLTNAARRLRAYAQVYFNARNAPINNGLPVAPDWHLVGPAIDAFLALR
jgi:beta-mannanase